MRLTHFVHLVFLAGSVFGDPGAMRLQASQEPRTPIDLTKLGPQIGQQVPDFNMKDQNGKSWTLQSIMGPKGALLVFQRSADW